MRSLRSTVAPLTLAWLALVTLALAAPAEETREPDTRPLLVKIHADWCGTCTRLEPTWQRLEADLGERARLVVLDVTDREALGRARETAEALGVGAFFEAHKGKTGTIGVLDGQSGEPVAVFKGELEVAPYQEALAKLERS